MDKNTNKRVAIKQLHLKGSTLVKNNPNFGREIDALKKLNNPYIIKFYLCYIDPMSSNVFIVTERCQTKDLGKYLQ